MVALVVQVDCESYMRPARTAESREKVEECRILEVWVEVDDWVEEKAQVGQCYSVAASAVAAHIHPPVIVVEAVGY